MTRRSRSVVPPVEDDSTYLTVVHPYPLNANLLLPVDRRTLALWLACCTGNQDVLRAMFHKPKGAGMVIIEVDQEFERLNALLGMHSWDEFLLAPTKEEEGKSSKVFFCTYNNAKAVRDAGWNRVEIEDHWFQGFRLDNDRIKHPYPKTTYCDLPPEAQTGRPMCRHLPPRLFPVTSPQQEPPSPEVSDDTEDNNKPRRSTAVAIMDIFGAAPNTAFVRGPRSIEEGAYTPEADLVHDQSRVDSKAAVEDNPWDGYDAPRQDPPTRVKIKDKEIWICPQHGPMCAPGICKARAQVERDERWRKEREEREESKKRWKERRGRRPRKRPDDRASSSRTHGSETEGEGSCGQGSSPSRTESRGPSSPHPATSPRRDSEETRTVMSAGAGGAYSDADREDPITAVQSTSVEAHSIGADGKERNKGKSKGKSKELPKSECREGCASE